MIIGRIIGWIFIIAAFLVLGRDILRYLDTGVWQSVLLGQLWFELDPEGLNLIQAVIQRYLLPEIWDPGVMTVLLWPAWLDFLVPGVLLVILFKRRKKAPTSAFES